MDIQDFIELCKIKVAKGETLEKNGVSQKIVDRVKKESRLIVGEDDPELVSFYKKMDVAINGGKDVIGIRINIQVSPIEKFFWIYYTSEICLKNRKIVNILFDELEASFHFPELPKGIFLEERKKCIAILRQYGYSEIPYELIDKRVDLYAMVKGVNSIDKLGGQIRLARILEFGLEYNECERDACNDKEKRWHRKLVLK